MAGVYAWLAYGKCEVGRHAWTEKWSDPQIVVNGMKKQSRFCTRCNAEQERFYS